MAQILELTDKGNLKEIEAMQKRKNKWKKMEISHLKVQYLKQKVQFEDHRRNI